MATDRHSKRHTRIDPACTHQYGRHLYKDKEELLAGDDRACHKANSRFGNMEVLLTCECSYPISVPVVTRVFTREMEITHYER